MASAPLYSSVYPTAQAIQRLDLCNTNRQGAHLVQVQLRGAYLPTAENLTFPRNKNVALPVRTQKPP